MASEQDANLSGLTPQELRIQRLLKVVVVALAIVILFVLGVIVTTVLSGGKRDRSEIPVSETAEAPASHAISFGETAVPLPGGAHITEMSLQGDVLALRYELPDGAEEIAIVGLDTGTVRGRLRIVPAD